MLHVDPAMLPRLEELDDDLVSRRAIAVARGWLGEIEGIDLTLKFLRDKKAETRRVAGQNVVDLGLPRMEPA